MPASYHSKLQLLAILVAALVLLSVPLFFQVRSDANAAHDQADSTVVSKWIQSIVNQFEDPPEDFELEESWKNWKQKHPNCEPSCEPGADLDGDGVSNIEELRRGSNPDCDEKTHGEEACQTNPQAFPPFWPARDDVLYYKKGARSNFQDRFSVSAIEGPNYDRWDVLWNATNQADLGSFRILLDDQNNTVFCCKEVETSPVQGTYSDRELVQPAPDPGSFQIRISTNGLLNPQGEWEITIRGIRSSTPIEQGNS